MVAPFAEYELTEKPEWAAVSLPLGGRAVLDPHQRNYVSRRPDDFVWVRSDDRLYANGWGGTRNHLIQFGSLMPQDNAVGWCVHELGSVRPALLNGVRLDRRVASLSSGDRIEPSRGLVFTFFQRDELEPLAAELTGRPEVFDADARVLLDWVLERRGCSEAEGLRICRHLALRLRHTGEP